MEQIIAFGLGVLVVLTIVGVITMFKSSEKKINNIHRRIGEEVNRLEEDMLKYVDSRTDKLESRIDSKINAMIK